MTSEKGESVTEISTEEKELVKVETVVIGVDPGETGAAVIMVHPSKHILHMIEWSQPAKTGVKGQPLKGQFVKFEDGGNVPNIDAFWHVSAGLSTWTDILVRCEESWHGGGYRKKDGSWNAGRGTLAIAKAGLTAGVWLALANPTSNYETLAPSEWRKKHGWSKLKSEPAKLAAIEWATEILKAAGQDIDVSEHLAEALAIAWIDIEANDG